MIDNYTNRIRRDIYRSFFFYTSNNDRLTFSPRVSWMSKYALSYFFVMITADGLSELPILATSYDMSIITTVNISYRLYIIRKYIYD